ncbi:MAG TPA: hypothetical protein PK728_06560 [Bacillota bacterium]|nr:hypothetical protein [Bacillota bacterium]
MYKYRVVATIVVIGRTQGHRAGAHPKTRTTPSPVANCITAPQQAVDAAGAKTGE